MVQDEMDDACPGGQLDGFGARDDAGQVDVPLLDTTLEGTTTTSASFGPVLVRVGTAVIVPARSSPGWSSGEGSRATAEKPVVGAELIGGLLRSDGPVAYE
ncbi:hypothetical protein CIB93_04835 [Streptomyces sp. WZ.A104]|nr:hypothetical protein CIB93_04835 [Streptomyces sp. WZ.A104]